MASICNDEGVRFGGMSGHGGFVHTFSGTAHQQHRHGSQAQDLLGVAADETALGWLERALPLDDVESNDIDLAGRFAAARGFDQTAVDHHVVQAEADDAVIGALRGSW